MEYTHEVVGVCDRCGITNTYKCTFEFKLVWDDVPDGDLPIRCWEHDLH